jgi:single-strand DNA-binding protein
MEMNKFIGMGRLGKDPEIRQAGKSTVCNFSIGIQRNFKNADGDYDTDWLPCYAFGAKGEFVHRYFSKGDRILICGEVRPRSYKDKNGETRYITEINVNEVEFCESPKSKGNGRDSRQDDFLSDDGYNLPFDF